MHSEKNFESIVNEFQPMVFNTALGIVQNENDAEDIAQDVFIKVFEKLDGFREDSKLSTWIYRIAVNQSLDFQRKKKDKLLIGETDAIEFHHPGIVLDQKENANYLFKAMKLLPEKQHAAFVLQQLEQLSIAEIAAILETTISAVDGLLNRAKENLRKYLKEILKANETNQ